MPSNMKANAASPSWLRRALRSRTLREVACAVLHALAQALCTRRPA
ncbi:MULTISPECIES: hypothetical protein [Myxococcaceae]|nr:MULTISPECIES: hypothetical protein [Myxococcaceae]MBF5043171.1 hypothetical protein [Simulacricoccus sp. 17bor-14]